MNLEELAILIPLVRSLRSIYPNTSARPISRPLIVFVQAQRNSLRSLTLTSFEHLNLTSYVYELGYFPCLNQLKLKLTFDDITLPNPPALTHFLEMHKATLQIINIQHHYGTESTTYSAWISQELPTLEFSALQTLGIGIWTCQFPQVPRLRTLDIPVGLSDSIPKLIEGLHRSSGKRQVKQVAFTSSNTLRFELHNPHCQTA